MSMMPYFGELLGNRRFFKMIRTLVKIDELC